MRLWSLHPRFLDARGLVALWREGLLAKAVLQGKTRGYRRHPQLVRFRRQSDPLAAIEAYLSAVWRQADQRGYRFDRSKLGAGSEPPPMEVTVGQLAYEWRHLLAKLERRDPARFEALLNRGEPVPHPLFCVVPGDIEPWEVVR